MTLALILALGLLVTVYAHDGHDRWRSLAPLPAAQGDGPPATGVGGTFGACVDGDPDSDLFYVAYGYDGAGMRDSRSLRIYNHEADEWTHGPAAPEPARRFVAGALHQGKLYCVGGGSDTVAFADAHRFDPSNNTWTAIASLPSPRVGAGAVSHPSRGLYVLGGSTSPAMCDAPTSSVLRYDEAAQAWRSAGSLAVPRAGAAVALVGKYVYLFGGCSDSGLLASVEQFDTWSGKSTILPVTVPGGERIRAAAAVLDDDAIHLTGGVDSFGIEVVPNHVVFDAEAGKFDDDQEAPLPTHCPSNDGRSGHALIEHDGQLWAIGGTCDDSFVGLSNLDLLSHDGEDVWSDDGD